MAGRTRKKHMATPGWSGLHAQKSAKAAPKWIMTSRLTATRVLMLDKGNERPDASDQEASASPPEAAALPENGKGLRHPIFTNENRTCLSFTGAGIYATIADSQLARS